MSKKYLNRITLFASGCLLAAFPGWTSAQDQIPSTQFEAIAWLEAERNTVTRNAKGDVTDIIIDYVPDTFSVGDLEIFPQLEVLEINYTGQFYDRHMSGIARLKNLKRFEVDYCDEISEASLSVLRYLPKLESLRLRNCEAVFSLEALANCTALKNVDLSDNEHLDFKVLGSLIRLEKLESLVLRNNSTLEDEHLEILAKFPCLKSLDLSACEGLSDEALIQLGKLNLKKLVLSDNVKISGTSFAGFESRTLEELDLESCGVTDEGLSGLASLTHIKRLDLRNNHKITGPGLVALGSFKMLETVILSGLPVKNEHLQTLAGTATLQEVDLSYCESVSGLGLEGLADSTGLEGLDVRGCRRLDSDEDFAVISKFESLKRLNVSQTRMRPESVLRLKNLLHLESLDVSGCKWVGDTELREIAEIKSLQELKLRDLPRLTDQGLAELARLTDLKELVLGANRQITGGGFSTFSPESVLQKLVVSEMVRLSPAGLKNLARLKSLKTLEIDSVPLTNEHLSALHGMISLRSLKLGDLSKVDEGNYQKLLATLPNICD